MEMDLGLATAVAHNCPTADVPVDHRHLASLGRKVHDLDQERVVIYSHVTDKDHTDRIGCPSRGLQGCIGR